MIATFALVGGVIASSAWLSSASSPESYFGGLDNAAYLEWANQLDLPATAFVPSSSDPDNGAALHWRIDGDYLELGVAVRATGWVGFGLTVNGGMIGSDMFLVEAKNPNVVKDAYVQDQRFPKEDDCQDWQMINSTIDSDFLMIQVRRKLDTGDNQDLVIYNDEDVGVPVSRVIAAWGDDETVSYHGPNNARGALRWFGDGNLEEQVFQEQMAAQSDSNFFLGAKNHSIPVIDTEYAYFCFSMADLVGMGVPMEDGVTLIGFSPIIDNTKHVHHYILQASFMDLDNSTACTAETAMGDLTYVWAPGEPSFMFPDNIGFKVGGTDGYQSFKLEIHYDNMDLAENQVDSSGVQLYYSLEPREHTAGYFIVGDTNVALAGQVIERGLTDYNFDCPGECSSLAVDEPVTVLRESLHMHQSGYSSYVEHMRNGSVIRRGSVDYYDFDQNGAPTVQQKPFQVHPGDSFTMKCYYKNDEAGRTFGLGSQNEMCMAFLLYYPRKTIEISGMQIPWICGVGLAEAGLAECDTPWTTKVLSDGETPHRSFGNPAETCEADSAGQDGSTDPTSSSISLALSSIPTVLALGATAMLFNS